MRRSLRPAGRILASTAAAVAVVLGLALVPTQPVLAAQPLLLEGKKTLFQRVLTRPGARLAAKAGANGDRSVPALSAFYVYERAQQPDGPWVLLGAGTDGRTTGWLPESATVPWRHAVTLAFSPMANRDRVLFFKDLDQTRRFVAAADAGARADAARKQIEKEKAVPTDSPFVAIEPATWVDPEKQFYLLPVLDARTEHLGSDFRSTLVKVASVTRRAPEAAPAGASTSPASSPAGGPGAAPADQPTPAALGNFNSAVTYVIDATSSMQPYIDRARSAMREVLRQSEEAGLARRIRFGLAAYQDDPKSTPGMEFLTRILVDPSTSDQASFLKAMEDLKATRNSTRAFAEDAYAGVEQAIRQIPWRDFGGRYIVLITDASAREGSSPLASTGLATDQLRQLAHETGIALFVMHLKTPQGARDHGQAQQQFMRLTDFPAVGRFYYPVEAGDPARFEADMKKLATDLVEQVKAPEKLLAAQRARTQPPAGGSPAPPATGKPAPTPAGRTESGNTAMDQLGKAMVLAYLGRQQGVVAPPLYEAWASQEDLANRDVKALQVRVLLTKNQLSDLQETLRNYIKAGTAGQVEPHDFFNQLRSAAITMRRDPSRIAQGKAKDLAQTGLLAEYMDGLPPYRSQIMQLDENGWINMGIGQQQAVLDELESKVAAYQRYHDDVDRWVKLNDAAPDGEQVYPVPIDALP